MILQRLVLVLVACGLGCGPDGGVDEEEEGCPGQPRICESFTFVREDDGVSLRSVLDQELPAPVSDVHCVLEALRDGTGSTHSFSDGFRTRVDENDVASRQFRSREVRVFEDGHVELIDSATSSFPDPASPEPRRAHFSVRPDAFFEQCLDSEDAGMLRDCLWEFEDQEVDESGCRAAVGGAVWGGT